MELSSDDYDFPESTEIHKKGPEAFQIYAAVCATLIFCISMSGNSFLLWVLQRERAWRTPSDIFLLQLTISNLFATVILPFLACNVFHSWIFGEFACGIMTWLFLLGWNSYVTILTAMTLHCYVTVVPLSCLPAKVTSKFGVVVASIVIWLVCAAQSIKLSVSSKTTYIGSGIITCGHFQESLPMLLFDIYSEIFLFFLIPFIIITFCYVRMWISIKQGRINRQDQPSKLILGITVGCFLCLAPHNIMHFIATLWLAGALEHTRESADAMHYLGYIIFALFHFNSCLNPLFLICGSRRFRRYLPMPFNTLLQRRDGSNNASPMAFIPLQNASA